MKIESVENSLPQLSPQYQRFVEEYVIDFNATQSAIRAGYAPHSATKQGMRLLKKGEIIKTIEAKLKTLTKNAELSANEVIARACDIIRSNINIADLALHPENIDLLDSRSLQLLKKVKITRGNTSSTEIEIHDPLRMIELMFRYYGLLNHDENKNKKEAFALEINIGEKPKTVNLK